MRPQFEPSAETATLVAIFKNMSIGQSLSYDELSKLAEFTVTPANAATARRMVERDHGVFIYNIRGYGLGRGSASAMVDSGYQMFSSVRSKMRKCADRMLLAISGNLDQREHRAASEMLSRANIIADTSKITRAMSNRSVVDPGRRAPQTDINSALRKLGKK